MSPYAVLIAMMLDPVRIALVIIAMWAVSKLYDKGERAMPIAVAMLACSVIMAFAIGSMRVSAYAAEDWLGRVFIGLIACYLIAAAIYGIVVGFKRIRA